jgi:hypothetical protein
VVLLLATLGSAVARAQPRTDVVILKNGDRITGEVRGLKRGQLEFKTDDAGTIDFEWDNVSRVESVRLFEVETVDGSRFLGNLGRADAGSIAVIGPSGTVSLPLYEVTFIAPIGQTFWRKLDGSFDAGFSYTKSSGIAQLNVNSETVYRRPRFEGRLAASATLTEQEGGGGRDDRGWLSVSYVRHRWPRWFVAAGGRFETNESLGLTLRSQVGVVTGPRLVNTNRAQMALGGGVVLNDERGVDAEPTQNIEAIATLQASYFTYDRPRTTLDLSLDYYPSLSNWGRQRLQLDASAKRELWKDLFLSVNLYDSFDSQPPNLAFDTNDVGVVLSVGWTY